MVCDNVRMCVVLVLCKMADRGGSYQSVIHVCVRVLAIIHPCSFKVRSYTHNALTDQSCAYTCSMVVSME